MDCILGSDWDSIVHSGNIIPIVAIIFGCTTGMVAIAFSAITGISKAKAREATKREIAAYVAEGSIEPEKAIAMLNAGMSSCEISDDGVKIT